MSLTILMIFTFVRKTIAGIGGLLSAPFQQAKQSHIHKTKNATRFNIGWQLFERILAQNRQRVHPFTGMHHRMVMNDNTHRNTQLIIDCIQRPKKNRRAYRFLKTPACSACPGQTRRSSASRQEPGTYRTRAGHTWTHTVPDS